MRKIVIVSFCADDWGGSEELWCRSIPNLQEAGFDISVVKYWINKQHPEFLKLADRKVDLIEIFPKRSIPSKIISNVGKIVKKAAMVLNLGQPKVEDYSSFIKIMKDENPELVIISQGINFDGLKIAHQCLLLKIPYLIIAQKAVDFYWPYKDDRAFMLETLLNAKQNCFVSHHNLRLTEEQFGRRLPNSQVVFNPVKLSGKIVPYPKSTEIYKIACLGRLFLLDKGQDILIRIMSAQKWRNRPLMVSFVGKGTDEAALKDMVALLNVTNVEFIGQIDDIENMWKDYHALVLPSRSEGLPLSMVEAMSAGRPVIISNAGGNAELVEEGHTGFIGYANEDSFDDAMERAWQRRSEWEEIGKNAATFVANNVPKSPETDFANLVLTVVNK
ncbi:glycosyltransferase family 4 protein [Pedobacter sp. MC2016-15]|uniref:glycosyltransferase family 4 protein n=1 Tax=Pedobacter sp. MC2016-15 TaxID=2994473 RepID=UPI0022463C96|nr:glycosyltransferase family 4 protein [Pedobacter sp. MC2016-15]MCX2479578.1 glycosyltransferase family 4 protein [Pedobacter sp. MC2016-15]